MWNIVAEGLWRIRLEVEGWELIVEIAAGVMQSRPSQRVL